MCRVCVCVCVCGFLRLCSPVRKATAASDSFLSAALVAGRVALVVSPLATQQEEEEEEEEEESCLFLFSSSFFFLLLLPLLLLLVSSARPAFQPRVPATTTTTTQRRRCRRLCREAFPCPSRPVRASSNRWRPLFLVSCLFFFAFFFPFRTARLFRKRRRQVAPASLEGLGGRGRCCWMLSLDRFRGETKTKMGRGAAGFEIALKDRG